MRRRPPHSPTPAAPLARKRHAFTLVEPPAVSKRGFTLVELPAVSKRGFTLVELLVVIAIIVALLAILMPSMGKAVAAAQRTVCASQLHQQGIALISFAGDHHGQAPPGTVNQFGAGVGSEAAWLNATPAHPEFGRYAGLGILIHEGYTPDHLIAFCPSHLAKFWVAPGERHPTINTIYGFIHPESDIPAGAGSMSVTYAYRSTFDAPSYRPARLNRDPGHTPVGADSFALVRVAHDAGYNVLRLDNSVHFVDDPHSEIRDFNGGSAYHAGPFGYSRMEVVWQTLLSR